MKRFTVAIVCTLSATMLWGCRSSFGPRGVEDTHPAYNQAIVNSMGRQMLLNLVRLKYRDSMFFLGVAGITASLTMGAQVGMEAELDTGPGSNLLIPNMGAAYSQTPTISYAPLDGEDFLKKVLFPIRLEALLVMTQSGWSIERVFGICLERINDLVNAPSASGPTPKSAPEFESFKQAIEILRELQLQDLIEIGAAYKDDSTLKDLTIVLAPTTEAQKQIAQLRALFGFTDGLRQWNITRSFLEDPQDNWEVRVRSIASVLFYLSQNVEVPQEHIDADLITITKTPKVKISSGIKRRQARCSK